MNAVIMTARERQDLCALIRRRERLEKTAAVQRSAELLADVERQLSSVFSYDNDENWARAYAAAEQAVEDANAGVLARCHELGIPERFAPTIAMGWIARGENASASRRSELRRLAQAKIAAAEKQARTVIESRSVELQEKIVTASLTSDAAREFLAQMPAVAVLMQPIDVQALLGVQKT